MIETHTVQYLYYQNGTEWKKENTINARQETWKKMISDDNEDSSSGHEPEWRNGVARNLLNHMISSWDKTGRKLRRKGNNKTARTTSFAKLSSNKQQSSLLSVSSLSTLIQVPKYKVRSCRHNRWSSFRSNLLNLTWSREWQGVSICCQNFPQEACVVNERGRCALHLASFSRTCPVPILVALLGANPHAVLLRDKDGYTPLHYACHFGHSIETIRLLCDKIINITTPYKKELAAAGTTIIPYDPTITAAAIDDDNYDDKKALFWSPLFLACNKNASIEIMQILLDTSEANHGALQWIAPLTGAEPWYCTCHPQELAMKGDWENVLPLPLLWRHGSMNPYDWFPEFEDLSCIMLTEERPDEFEVDKCSLGKSIVLFRATVRRMHTGFYKLLRDCPDKKGQLSNQLLYFASSLAFPTYDLVSTIVKMYFENCPTESMIAFADEWMYSPVHHVLLSFQRHQQQHNINNNESTSNDHIMYHLEETVCKLLHLYNERIVKKNGDSYDTLNCSSLLQLAIECHLPWNSGILPTGLLPTIINVEPDIIACKNKNFAGMFPFMYAAACDSSIETIYQLLRLDPSIILHYQCGTVYN